MKTMKKLASILLVLMLLMALAVPGMAAGNGNTVTITNVNKDQQFDAYQIFAGDYFEGSLSNITWGSGVTPDAEGKIGGKTAAEWVELLNGQADDSADAKGFADTISQHLSTVYVRQTAASDGAGYSVKWEGLADGYYLFKNADGTVAATDGYTRFMLQVVGDVDTTATVKADTTTSDKEITGVTPVNGTKITPANHNGVDVNIGDTVEFTLTATLPDNYGDYEAFFLRFNDTMSKGLIFNEDSLKVTVVRGETSVADIKIPDYSLTKSTNADNTTLTILIENLKALGISLQKDDVVTVVYTATLGEDTVSSSVETNTLTVDFSNNPNSTGTGTTTEKKVYVYNFDIDIDKYDTDSVAEGAETGSKKLSNAKFVLYRENNGAKEYYKLTADGVTWVTLPEGSFDENGALTEAAKNLVTEVATDSSGVASFQGLEAGTYYLQETEAPNGYNRLSGSQEVKIEVTYNTDGTLATNSTSGDGTRYYVTSRVGNSSGVELPSTGGIGTTIFTVAGIVLMVGAAVLFIAKKRSTD